MTDQTAEPVVREWRWEGEYSCCVPADTKGNDWTAIRITDEHNALARAYLAKVKEIEGLKVARSFNHHMCQRMNSPCDEFVAMKARAEAAEARCAELEKALEGFMRNVERLLLLTEHKGASRDSEHNKMLLNAGDIISVNEGSLWMLHFNMAEGRKALGLDAALGKENK